MTVAASWLVASGEIDDATPGVPSGMTMAALIAGFVVLFVLSGVGNGSTYKMIPSIFEAKSRGLAQIDAAERQAWSRRMSGALIGIAGAVGALGGVGVNMALRASYLSPAKSATMAFWAFLAFYVLCGAMARVAYVRAPRSSTVNAAGHPAYDAVSAA